MHCTHARYLKTLLLGGGGALRQLLVQGHHDLHHGRDVVFAVVTATSKNREASYARGVVLYILLQ